MESAQSTLSFSALQRAQQGLVSLWYLRYRYVVFWLCFIVGWWIFLAPRADRWLIPLTLLVQYLYIYIPVVYVHNRHLMPKLFFTRQWVRYLGALAMLMVGTMGAKQGLDWAFRSLMLAIWEVELPRIYYGETLWVQVQRVGEEMQALLGVIAIGGIVKTMKYLHEIAVETKRVSIPSELFFKVDKRMVRVPLASIWYVEGLKDYVILQTDTEKLVVKKTMKYMAEHLPASSFQRIHRSYIINTKALRAVTTTNVEMPDRMLPIGETYRDAFLATLDDYMIR